MLAFRRGGATHLQREALETVLDDLHIRQNQVEMNALKFVGGILHVVECAKNDQQSVYGAERAHPGSFLLLSAETGPGKIEVLNLRWDAFLRSKQVTERLKP